MGSLYPQPLLEMLRVRKQFVDYPANIFQRSFLNGLDAHYSDIRVISSPVIHSKYQIVKDICKKSKFSHKGDEVLSDINVGNLPIPGGQMLFELFRVYKALRRETKGTKKKANLVIYALHSPFLLAAVFLRKKIGCSCVIVPDLPEFMSMNDGFVRKLAKKLDRAIIDFCLKRLDCYVLLSPYMRDRLPIRDKPWVLMEGIFDTNLIPKRQSKCKERVILYSGNLSRQYGIMELLEAFHQIDNKKYRLWICGRGDGEINVERMAQEDDRIIFWGVVSHEMILKLQQQATVLINPRSSAGEYTKYSFPSKTMEYLASGTPTIMCHLPAVPKEYDEFIYYIEQESVEGIRNKIIEICEKPQLELDEYGFKASEFIKKQKNAFVQAKKVVDMIEKVERT